MGADRRGRRVNKAVTIDGKRNDFRAFLRALDIMTRGVREDAYIDEVGRMMSTDNVGELIQYRRA
jgi:hypothetical protein